jgi:hypothetical protein
MRNEFFKKIMYNSTFYIRYNFGYEDNELGKHKAFCDCGLSIIESHFIVDSICICCGHVHSYTKWKYYNDISHVVSCNCGEIGTIIEPHYIRKEDIGKSKAFCLGCGAKLDLSGDIAIAPMPLSLFTKVSENGSFIMPCGIVVLQEIDIESYENGTLIFHEKDTVHQVN